MRLMRPMRLRAFGWTAILGTVIACNAMSGIGDFKIGAGDDLEITDDAAVPNDASAVPSDGSSHSDGEAADSATDAGETIPTGPKSIRCGKDKTCQPGTKCCLSIANNAGRCVAPLDGCNGGEAAFFCDDSSDCDGYLCCARRTGAGVDGAECVSKALCPSTDVLCQDHNECGDGGSCSTPAAGAYLLCK